MMRTGRYLKSEYDAMREKQGWSTPELIARYHRVYDKLVARNIGDKAIFANGLDNPFMTEQARELLISMMAPSSFQRDEVKERNRVSYQKWLKAQRAA